MNDSRYNVTFPISLTWKDKNGKEVTEDGLTEIIGHDGALVYVPRRLPDVGSRVCLTVFINFVEFKVTTKVTRLNRSAEHPQIALELLDSKLQWRNEVWRANKFLADSHV